jgi:hypothetical protein
MHCLAVLGGAIADLAGLKQQGSARRRPFEDVRQGAAVGFEPKEKYWHRGTPTTAMTHMVIHEKLNGNLVDSLERVTDVRCSKTWNQSRSTPRGKTRLVAVRRRGLTNPLHKT